jgi:hypothetical protein
MCALEESSTIPESSAHRSVPTRGHAMEYVRISFPSSRFVYIDGEQSGRTNEVLRVEAGTHAFDLGRFANYAPAAQELAVEGTSVLAPLEVAFARKEA